MNRMKWAKPLGMAVLAVLFLYGCAAKVPTTNSPASTNENTSAATNKKPSAKKAKKKEEVYSPVGVWEYIVDTPDGGSSGIMRIIGEPGAFEATLETDQFGTLEIQELDIVGTAMTGTLEVAGTVAELEGDFDGEDFSGAVVMGDDVFPIEGTRTSKGK